MDKEILSRSLLFREFQKAAKKRRLDPIRLLTDYMREYVEVWGDQELDDEIGRAARCSGYREKDSVEIVRRHRSEKARLHNSGSV